MDALIDWFRRLGGSTGFDPQTVDSTASLRQWFLALEPNQQVAALVVAGVGLMSLFFAFKLLRLLYKICFGGSRKANSWD